MAVGDSAQSDELIRAIRDGLDHEFHTYITALFSLLTAKYFENDSSPEALRRYVLELRHDFRTAEPPFKALAMEGLLRAFFGEDHLMSEIDASDQPECELMSIRKMVFDSPMISAALDRYLSDAETVAREWETEDAQA